MRDGREGCVVAFGIPSWFKSKKICHSFLAILKPKINLRLWYDEDAFFGTRTPEKDPLPTFLLHSEKAVVGVMAMHASA